MTVSLVKWNAGLFSLFSSIILWELAPKSPSSIDLSVHVPLANESWRLNPGFLLPISQASREVTGSARPGNRGRQPTGAIVLAPSCATHIRGLDTVRSNQPSPVTLQPNGAEAGTWNIPQFRQTKETRPRGWKRGRRIISAGCWFFSKFKVLTPFFMAWFLFLIFNTKNILYQGIANLKCCDSFRWTMKGLQQKSTV